jgi:hypothetical protein
VRWGWSSFHSPSITFRSRYLPYRDPETLKSFLKIINEFSYDHSERLGDAFEYLLSVLGSQGDAGQFRTPRHIIDFIVSIVDPKKTESILDPACGTAGFLISAYKHIVRANTNAKGEVNLAPEEKGRLAKNIKGYDISPDMVRLSLVNLYLHGFPLPQITEYDTLTQEDKWNELADVTQVLNSASAFGIPFHERRSADGARFRGLCAISSPFRTDTFRVPSPTVASWYTRFANQTPISTSTTLGSPAKSIT